MISKQSGQSMVEYTVVLVALVGALYVVTADGKKGGLIASDKQQQGSLLQLMHHRYTRQNMAIRISELPEKRNLKQLADYYQQLDKYPKLSQGIENAGNKVSKLTEDIESVNKKMSKLIDYQKQVKKTLEQIQF